MDTTSIYALAVAIEQEDIPCSSDSERALDASEIFSILEILNQRGVDLLPAAGMLNG